MLFKKVWLIIGLLLGVLAACAPAAGDGLLEGKVESVGKVVAPVAVEAEAEEVDVPSDESSDEPPVSIVTLADGTREMMNCMAREPESLYLYAGASGNDESDRSAGLLHYALYDRLYTRIGGEVVARGLAELPSEALGTVVWQDVLVGAGDVVMLADGSVAPLAVGMVVGGVTFTGERLVVRQAVVDFSLQPMVWSDGMAVSARDSVFSYGVASHTDTPVDKTRVSHTASYVATGALSVRWTSVPGWVGEEFVAYAWTPLPFHQLGGIAPGELLGHPLVTESPLSYGAYVVAEWVPGSHITLAKNPHFYRAETYPGSVDRIRYAFLEVSG